MYYGNYMTTLVLILWLLLAIGLTLITAARPLRTKHSMFELKRRGDQAILERERLLGDVYALRRAAAVLLVMALTISGWVLWQELGVFIVLIMLPVVLLMSRSAPIARYAMKTYGRQEQRLLDFVAHWPKVGWLLGSERQTAHDQRIESKEHLVHLVESAGHILTPQQQKLIARSLDWHSTTVAAVMTPAEDIITLPHRELLGPLVLDDLHKSGHQRFPVVRGSIDHVIGMVNIAELLRVDAIQKSLTAEKAMTPIDARVALETTLPEALKAMSAHPDQLGLVIDDEDKTVGLITLDDILGALLG